ncbi:MAG: DUF4340 domain-containing protein [Candidatus Firestonebacteria bacterium]
MKKFKATYIVIGIFILLAVYIYFFERGEVPSKKIKIFSDIKKEDINKIELNNVEKNETIICEKIRDNEWQIISPKRYDIEQDEIDSLVNNFVNLDIDREFKDKELRNLKDYGLDAPSFKAIAYFKNGKSATLFFGQKTPSNSYYFVQPSDKNVVCTAATYSVENVKKDIPKLRKKSIFLFDTEKVTKILLAGDKGPIECEKDDKGDWRVKSTVSVPGDKNAIESIVNTVKNSRIQEFIEDEPKDLGKYGLKKSKISIKIWEGKDKVIASLLFGKKMEGKEQVYVKNESAKPVYAVFSSIATDVHKGIDDLKDKKIEEKPKSTTKGNGGTIGTIKK